MSLLPSVFISYSHQDSPWVDRLMVHLKPVAAKRGFRVFIDRNIEAGRQWDPTIEHHLTTASVVVCQLSPDFLASDYILERELPVIKQRMDAGEIEVIWFPVEPCAVEETWLRAVQAAWTQPLADLERAGPNQALKTIAQKIGRAVEQQQPLPESADTRDKPERPLPKPRVQVARMPVSGEHLFGRDAELAALDAAWADPKLRIFSLVAFGGVGKTALVNHWLARMATDDWRGARRVYTWSFYSQGGGEDRQASGDAFLDEALRWFGDPDPSAGEPFAKGTRLAELVAVEPTLLVLDGLEPLQYASPAMLGRLKDAGLKTLLRQLAAGNNGLCLLTTRLKVTDLDHHVDRCLKRVFLEKLSEGAGCELLRSAGCKGSKTDFGNAVAEFEGHALALNLVANYLIEVHGGDLRRRDRLPPLETEPSAGGHAARVLDGYEKLLRPAEAALLRLVGLFDRPAEHAAVAALRAEPVIAGLTEPLVTLDETGILLLRSRLAGLGLLAKGEPDTPLDAHPLVREHFGARLENEAPDAWRAAHARLYEHYRDLPKKHLPDTLTEMEPLFRAVTHGCRAGRAQETLDEVYWPRILRQNKAYVNNQLGANGADLATLAGFFAVPWTSPDPTLEPKWQAGVLSWAGFALRALGRLREATQPMEACFHLGVSQENWKAASIRAGNLSELWLALGNVAEAVRWAEKAVAHADQSGDAFLKMGMRTILADARHQAGDRAGAAALFAEAETLQKQHQPEYPLLYSVRGYLYCDLLLAKGDWRAVRDRAEKAHAIAVRNQWLLDMGLDELSLGRAAHAAWHAGAGSAEDAESGLDRALAALRSAGDNEFVFRGLLARAAFMREAGRLEEAARDLAEAREIAELGDMKLYLVDILLEEARLAEARGKAAIARERYAEARALIDETGYHRRDDELPPDLRPTKDARISSPNLREKDL